MIGTSHVPPSFPKMKEALSLLYPEEATAVHLEPSWWRASFQEGSRQSVSEGHLPC